MKTGFFVVWGMHRSGTSLLAGAARVFGAEAGVNVIGADMYNPKGYFEDKNLLALNEQMLAMLNMKWHSLGSVGEEETAVLESAGFLGKAQDYLWSRARGGSGVVLKDPRMTRLAPIWRKAFARVGIAPYSLVVWRQPLAVAQSLRKRALNIRAATPVRDLRHGLLLWLGYTLAALRYTKGLPRVLVGYEDFLSNPAGALAAISAKFGLALEEARLAEFCAQFVEPGLNHYAQEPEKALPGRISQLQKQLENADFLEFPSAIGPMWPATDEERELAELLDSANNIIRENGLKNL